MAAIIKTYLNGDPTTLVEGASRDDLRPGDVVTCEAGAAPGGEYRWTLAFAPMDEAGAVKSAATVDGQETDPQCSFSVDHEGAYLVRLIIDPGTSTESTQFVRLRSFGTFWRSPMPHLSRSRTVPTPEGTRSGEFTGWCPIRIQSPGHIRPPLRESRGRRSWWMGRSRIPR